MPAKLDKEQKRGKEAKTQCVRTAGSGHRDPPFLRDIVEHRVPISRNKKGLLWGGGREGSG